MIDFVNRHFILPAYMKWNNDDRLKLLKKYEKYQWASSDEICNRQFNDFLAILKYAYMHVPFYRKRFDSFQVHPEDIKNPDDTRNIPILTKKDLQENLDTLISDACPPSQRYKNASGGSTGHPTIFYGDKNCLSSKFAALMMSDKWTGCMIGEKRAYLWGADREVNRIRSMKEKFVQQFVYRIDMLNAFSMNEEDMEQFAKLLLVEKPRLIVAYANAIYRFAQFLKQKGISGIAPKGIVSSAETLNEVMRHTIQEVFNCKVLNRYGSREVALIASECDFQQGLHINTIGVYAELIPISSNDPELLSEIIITDLENHVMPLIRYNTGDTSAPINKMCECGRGLPLMGSVRGRSSDFIVHPNGKFIHGEYFSHIFYGVEGLVQFQIIQHSLNTIEVNLVINDMFSIATKTYIENKLSEALDETVQIKVSFVEAIAIPPSGKYRFAISYVLDNGK